MAEVRIAGRQWPNRDIYLTVDEYWGILAAVDRSPELLTALKKYAALLKRHRTMGTVPKSHGVSEVVASIGELLEKMINRPDISILQHDVVRLILHDKGWLPFKWPRDTTVHID